MGKYQTVLNAMPEGATHVDIDSALSQLDGNARLGYEISKFFFNFARIYRKNVDWYEFTSKSYRSDYRQPKRTGVKKAFRLIGSKRPENIISIDGLKILAKQFG